ncbi:hypothetical protein L218DRAFT_1079025 [Marasmius fiardii PR-910]|nr:hypothetical protein L218DRAFT_1079025 [Marasmius fiardii PR-910]
MLTTLTVTTFEHSYGFNPHWLEHFLYVPWSVILNKLISKHSSVLIPAPQYPIYVSSQSPPTSNDPDETIPDSTAAGMYVDHVVILPHLGLLPQLKDSKSTVPTTLAEFLQSISEPVVYDSHEWWPKVTINTVEVPIMAEIKPDLLLIAGTGNWWCCRLITRESYDLPLRAFDMNLYELLKYEVGELEGDDSDRDDVKAEDKLPEFAPPSEIRGLIETRWDTLAQEKAIRGKKQTRESGSCAETGQRGRE